MRPDCLRPDRLEAVRYRLAKRSDLNRKRRPFNGLVPDLEARPLTIPYVSSPIRFRQSINCLNI